MSNNQAYNKIHRQKLNINDRISKANNDENNMHQISTLQFSHKNN